MHTKKGGFQMFRLLYLHLYPLVTFHTGNDMHLHILGVYCRYRPSIIIQSPCLLQKLLPASFCIIHSFLHLIHY